MDIIRVKEAATLLGVSPQTLRRWDRTGRLTAHRHPLNGYRLYDREAVMKLREALCPDEEVRVSRRSTRSVPRHRSPFVGREDVLALLRSHLSEGTGPISVVGAPGVGKSRLAAEAVEGYDQVTWVNLSRDDISGCGAYGIVVFDQADHAHPDVIGALAQRSGPTLVTSRRPLGLSDETVIRLGPLAPDEGVKILPDRGLAGRLDGVPLLLEAARFQFDLFGADALAERLDLDTLTIERVDAPAHHRRIAEAVDWTAGDLDPALRSVLQACSVFHGGFSLEAAERVLGATTMSTLQTLCRHALVENSPGRLGPRFRILAHVRSWALRGGSPARAEEWGDWLREEISRRTVVLDPSQGDHRDWVRDEWGNLRAFTSQSRPAEALNAALLMARVGDCEPDETREILVGAISAAEQANVEPSLLGAAYTALLSTLLELGEIDALEEGLRHAAAYTKTHGLKLAEAELILLQASTELELKTAPYADRRSAVAEGVPPTSRPSRAAELRRAMALLEGADARTTLDRNLQTTLLVSGENTLAEIAWEQGDQEGAMHLLLSASARAEQRDYDLGQIKSNFSLASLHVMQGDLAGARTHMRNVVAVSERSGQLRELGNSLGHLASIEHALGDHSAAFVSYERAMETLERSGEALLRQRTGARFAFLLATLGEFGRAEALVEGLEHEWNTLEADQQYWHLWRVLIEIVGGDSSRAEAELEVAAGVDLDPAVAWAASVVRGALETPARWLQVGEDGAWFWRGGAVVELGRKRILRRLLDALATAAAERPAETVSRTVLLGICWPDERMIGSSGLHRLRVAVASLRKLGLDELIAFRDGGYLLDVDAVRRLAEPDMGRMGA